MPEQVLSQEEIDALMNAMDSGEIELEEDGDEPKGVKPYNLTSQSITLRDQFSVLEEVYAKFSELWEHSMRSLLQKDISVSFTSKEIKKFADALKTFPTPTFFNIFQMEPLIGSALLAIDSELVFPLIDCLFGGPGQGIDKTRNFTLIEQRIMEKISAQLLKDFQEAWGVVSKVNITSRKTETRPAFLHMIDPNDYVVSIVFTLNGGGFSGDVQICLGYLMLEPIKDKLSFKYLREKEREHAWNAQLQGLLQSAEVEVVAELASAVRTVRGLLSWKKEDILRLDKGPQDPVLVHIEGVPKFWGTPGVLKGSRAVQIGGTLKANGGN